jgi:hypothetical protein
MGIRIEPPRKLLLEGVSYLWTLRHGCVVESGEGLKGVSVSVLLDPGKRRELILDLPFATFGLERHPSSKKVEEALKAAIPAAIEAGWNPESRGKAFRYLQEPRQNLKPQMNADKNRAAICVHRRSSAVNIPSF